MAWRRRVPPPLITLSKPRPAGEPASYEVKVRNDSEMKQAVIVRGSKQNADVVVKWFKGDKNITDKVVDLVDETGGKKFKGIEPGDSTPLLRMRVHAKTYLTSPEYGIAYGRVASYIPEGTCQPDLARAGVREPEP
jgi:hypothetical protein